MIGEFLLSFFAIVKILTFGKIKCKLSVVSGVLSGEMTDTNIK